MRRNVVSLGKYVCIAAITVICTVRVFKLLRPTPSTYVDLQPLDDFDSLRLVHSEEKLEKSKEKKDWHDYAFINGEQIKRGLGEQGKAVHFPEVETEAKKKLYSENGFNALLSDVISLQRSIPDIRHPDCKTKKYYKNLPTASIIVPFHNEHFSSLLRTVYSVINRSPAELLKEVILVDDCSTKDFLKDKLDRYLKANFSNVHIIHLPKREGLIRARLAGAKSATAEVLIFLDSHTEANVNWLPPLLEPIADDYRTCVCPFIDVIDYETFEIRAQDEGARGAFDWEFFYKRLPLLPEDKKHPTVPFRSPVMAGGLFAISTKFFWELGGYDEGLDIWGGEQYELSFKIWQCHGQMFDAACSRVAHIYRKFAPFPNPGIGDFIGKNYRRVAEVWMDEYAEFLYKRRPHYRKIDPGDLTKQRAIRERLQCKPFKWFMESVAFDLPKVYPPVEPEPFFTGEIRSATSPKYCVDTNDVKTETEFGLELCAASKDSQKFEFTWHKDIRLKGKNQCWDVSSAGNKAPVTLYTCHNQKGNQLWKFDVSNQWIVHGTNPRCLDSDIKKKKLFLAACDEDSLTQKWRPKNLNLKALASWSDDVEE